MPAPNTPNPAPAAAARRRLGDQTAAARLRAHGWLALPPEAAIDPDLLAMVATAFETDGGGCDHRTDLAMASPSACSTCLAVIAVRTLYAGRAL